MQFIYRYFKHKFFHSLCSSPPLLSVVAFNEYVHLTGCTSNKHPRVIRDDMPVLHLLSYSMDGEHGNDLLYTVISDMVRGWAWTVDGAYSIKLLYYVCTKNCCVYLHVYIYT